MPVTYFIADLHLSPEHPEITTCLKHFLATQAIHADALYVLGDLFEAWIGDDDTNPFTQEVAQAFKQLAKHHVPVYFIHGNRDFLIRKAFAKRAGMTLLPESEVIDLYGEATLIMHGDELCTKDEAYQRFRRKARSWWWPRLVLMLPLSVRRRIAARGRRISQQNQSNLSQDIMDVTPEEVVRVMQLNSVKRLIHGHTHRPAIHDLEVNCEHAQRIVLGDWYTQGSMLKVTPTEITLETMQFKD